MFFLTSDTKMFFISSLWDKAAENLKGETKLAIVDVELNPEIIDLFLLYELPKCILFTAGNMYVYNGP